MRGFTLLELLIVVVLAGMVMAIAVPRTQAALDRTSVRSAAAEVRATLGVARTLALAGASTVAVHVDSTGTLRIRRGDAVLMTRNVGLAHGVTVRGSRDSLAYDVYGMGRGAANLSIVVRRRSAVDTVFVSRLGRIR